MKKALIIFLLLGCSCALGDEIVTQESLEAAFIFHFIGFTQWQEQPSEYDVCVPGNDSFKAVVQASLEGKQVNGRIIRVFDRYDHCQILVTDNVMAEPSVFTIGSLANGALLEFRVVDNKLKFAVNMATLKNSKLKISSQLLKLAILENG